FGGNATPFRGERHPIHGETANATWKFESLDEQAGRACLHLSLRTQARPARVDKRLYVMKGHNAVYCRHVVSGARGPMSVGHHAMVKFPDQPGSGRISTSPFGHGQVFPQAAELPENRGYSMLKPGAVFKSLDQVPTVFGTATDLSSYPARRGYEDIVMLVSSLAACPIAAGAPFAWTAVTFAKERYVWFALKDPHVLRSTIFWISNGGRHYPPWNGRHVNVMGLEEVTSYFHPGLSESAQPNPLSARGIPTFVRLEPARPLVVSYIVAVTPVPPGFDRVSAIEAQAQSVVLKSAAGLSVNVPLDVSFLHAPAMA
ncbi:MAG: hypothetical protein NTW87_33700, partial [Planctomycetota bacterium]|nr:hypothetical protein [Planctomycetota bacterium]